MNFSSNAGFKLGQPLLTDFNLACILQEKRGDGIKNVVCGSQESTANSPRMKMIM